MASYGEIIGLLFINKPETEATQKQTARFLWKS